MVLKDKLKVLVNMIILFLFFVHFETSCYFLAKWIPMLCICLLVKIIINFVLLLSVWFGRVERTGKNTGQLKKTWVRKERGIIFDC